jgi:hypothetical protein
MNLFTNCCEENNQKKVASQTVKIRKEKTNVLHNNAQNQPKTCEKNIVHGL